jgi:YesN/AraC family two-component response regulator
LFQQKDISQTEFLGSKEASILIVDDEPITRALCGKALEDFHIVQAQNGHEAMAVLAEREVDLVLSDVIMPYMSGLDLLRAIKERKPDQTVIIMTGLGDREVVLNALRALLPPAPP